MRLHFFPLAENHLRAGSSAQAEEAPPGMRKCP